MLEQYTRIKFVINRLKRRLMSQVWLARIVLLFVLLLLLAALLIPLSKLNSFRQTYASASLASSVNRTNILLLGIGGVGHESPDLTDTLILASYHHPTHQLSLLSIPRDLWLPSLKTKINAAYQLGNLKQSQGGLILAKSAVSEVIGVPVHYALVLDFATFQQAIDILGGVDIHVATAFEDPDYPLAGRELDLCAGDTTYRCRYETIKFAPGLQHMDGSTALKYVRSRHSPDLAAGTDFARNSRQKEVLSTIASRLSSPETLRHPKVYFQLFNLFTTNITTDIPPTHLYSLAKLIWSARTTPFKSYALTAPEQLYHPQTSPLYSNQWILLPKNNDPNSITDFVSSILN